MTLLCFVVLTLSYPQWSGNPVNDSLAHAGTLAGVWVAPPAGPPVGPPPARQDAAASRADWVARQVRDRDVGRDSRIDLRMRLFDRQGRLRERALTILARRGAAAPPPAGARGGDQVLIRFSFPNDIKGTGFLVWEHPDADDERFLYLPSLGRVRRIAGSEAQESFVGSDLTYEDVGGRQFEDYTYRLLDENALWRAPDGTTHAAYRLESRRKDARARYPRVVSLVRKDNFVVVSAEIHNRRDEREKRFEVTRLDVVQGVWTVLAMTMVNDADRTRTELEVEKAEYNVGLTSRDFTRRELERGAR